ncbi:peptidoglycan editing factor PgeF [Halobacillus sp. A1]|uniref:peptidoglycan editing factor PgeF n=1 Tax=Halobacillus sp. A1 TaxID=2880262 RepID=UPI0020A65C8F|nr:peptidoglycan editing factor PgeF [Halobacillus sp. A1]MCP3031116.1 peptidoglycan editing factor PgeF [Halobacillus sp. A1]
MTEPFQRKSKKYYTCVEANQVIAGISSREDGYSEVPFSSLNMGLHVSDNEKSVIQNRKALAEELSIPLENWVMGEQVHGTSVAVITPEDKGKGAFSQGSAITGTDGMITNHKDILLTAFYADCVPLLFVEPDSGWIGIAHAGWKGSVHEIARHMVEKLSEQGIAPTQIHLTIGPSISQKNYEVDDHVMSHVKDELKSKVSEQISKNKFKLDLKELNRQIAINAGILNENIRLTNYCTYEDQASFFSHRRDHGQTGRMLAFIGRKS